MIYRLNLNGEGFAFFGKKKDAEHARKKMILSIQDRTDEEKKELALNNQFCKVEFVEVPRSKKQVIDLLNMWATHA